MEYRALNFTLIKLDLLLNQAQMLDPSYLLPLSDTTIVTARAMVMLKFDYSIRLLIHLNVYADDISAVLIADNEAKLQLAVNIMMENYP